MTEAEWLTSDDPFGMWDEALERFGETRKLWLFLCAACRPLWALLTEESRELLLVVERFAEAGVGYGQWDERAADRAARCAEDSAVIYAALTLERAFKYGEHMIRTAAGRSVDNLPGRHQEDDVGFKRELVVQCHLLRDIFGNPFRPVAFSPEWRTSTAVAIAQGMYESRDFSAMPILADALQDAGCDNDDVLNHCRGTGPHVCGCWVVDLVLGKE